MTTDTYNYTGGSQTWNVPSGVRSCFIKCYGAGAQSQTGGYAEGLLSNPEGSTLYIYVGQGRTNGDSSGGYPDGGDSSGPSGGTYSALGNTVNMTGGSPGAGSSNVRVDGTANGDRVIVAGGAGGQGRQGHDSGGDTYGFNTATTTGGNGNGGTASDAEATTSTIASGGSGGSRSGPGGGSGAYSQFYAQSSNNRDMAGVCSGGGGGGGYYGGGGGGQAHGKPVDGLENLAAAGGGGGSCYVGGVVSGTTSSSGAAAGTDGQVVIGYAAVPSTPTGLTATPTAEETIHLSWSDAGTPDGFRIYRSTSPGVTTADTLVTTVAGTTTTYDDTVNTDTTYYYMVEAYVAGPNSTESYAQSSEQSATTSFDAPSNLVVTGVTGDQISVSWTDNSSVEDGYRVYVSTDAGSSWTQDGSDLAANTTSYTTTNLLDGERYWFKVEAFTSYGATATDSNDVTQTTDLPDAPAPTLDGSTPGEIAVTWTDVIDNGSYRIEYRLTGAGSWTDDGTEDQATTSHTITGLLDGADYDVRIRTETSHVIGSWTSTVSTTTVVTTPTGLTVPTLDWYETLSYDITWTDNSNNEDGYHIQISDDGGSTWSTVASVGADVESYTLSTADGLAYDTDYDVRVQAYTSSASANSATVSIVTPLVEASSQTGTWLGLVASDDTAADRRQVDSTIIAVDTVREHSALSDWHLTMSYDETLEDWTFAEAHLYHGSDHLFAGELVRVESDEGSATTRLSGYGAPGLALKRGDAVTSYTDEVGYTALQDYLDNYSTIGGTVTATSGTSVSGIDIESLTSTADFASAAGTPGASEPWEAASGEIHLVESAHFVEAENADVHNGSTTADASASGGYTVSVIDISNDWSHTFSLNHTIADGDVGLRLLVESTDGTNPEFDVTVGGTTVQTYPTDSLVSGRQWLLVSFATSPGSISGNVTVTIEPTGASAGNLYLDAVCLYDTNYSHTFDTSVDANGALNGPEPYPDEVTIDFAAVASGYRIQEVSIDATFNDTTGVQAIGWSEDGTTWNDTSNTGTVTDAAVTSNTLTTVYGRITLGRTDAGTTPTTTPTDGTVSQALTDWTLSINGDTVGVIEDETVNGTHFQNIQKLAKRAGLRWYLAHDPDEANWTVEAFADGDRVATADWTTLNRRRTVDVEGYANRVVGYGAKQGDGSRLRVALDNTAEQTAVGQTIERSFVDPSLDNTAALRSAVRTALGNAIDEDDLTGRIEVVPEGFAPGVAYEVPAWFGITDGRYGYEQYGQAAGGEPTRLSLDRVSYRVSAGEAMGILEFSAPGGLGEVVSAVDARVGEVGDAV